MNDLAERNRLEAEARRLRRCGLGVREIGRELGVSHQTVSYWLDPEHGRRKAREQRQRASDRLPTPAIQAPPRWDTALAADGLAVVAWLERNHQVERIHAERWRKRIRRWSRGERASVWVLDGLLIELGLHLSQVPDDAWIPYRREAA